MAVTDMLDHSEAVALFGKVGPSALALDRTAPMVDALAAALLTTPPRHDLLLGVLRRALCAAYDLGQLDYPHIKQKGAN